MDWRQHINYTIRHTVPGGWCGLIAVGFLVSLFALFLQTTDIPICSELPPFCWWIIFPLLVMAGLFWMGMLGHFPTEFITEDEEEKAPLSETPQVEEIYDPKSGLPGLLPDEQDNSKPERL